MFILKHRANKISDIDARFGVEIDVRDYGSNIVLSHDKPGKQAIKLSDYLNKLQKNTMVAINAKSSEIESDIYNILGRNKHVQYFTFDWSVPSLIKALQAGLVCAFRMSEYEKEIHPGCSWVWVDAFHSIWYDQAFLKALKSRGLKLALVSPELHGRADEMSKLARFVSNGLVDAICTDLPEYWYNDKGYSL